MMPEQEDEKRMAAGFDEALKITEAIVDGMTETIEQTVLRIANEMRRDAECKKLLPESWWKLYARRVAAAIPEGCTPTDAMMLRKANHDLAQESHKRAELLVEWLNTELDAQDEEYQPWLDSFTERVKAAIAAYLETT